jgi:hypothetical protein
LKKRRKIDFSVAAFGAWGEDEFKLKGLRMKSTRMFCFLALALAVLTFSRALAADVVDSVTVKDGKIYSQTGDTQELLADNLTFPGKIEISTNGTFKVADGKDRVLNEGQVLRRDGWLLNPNGAAQPVFDHVTAQGTKVMVVKDGQSAVLTQQMDFPNGLSVSPDGTYVPPNAPRTRFVDGQIFRMDGTPVPAKDSVTMKNGQVVVQKDGTLITLKPVQIMGMSDGTSVSGNGLIRKFNGSSFQLREGQIILVDGVFRP